MAGVKISELTEKSSIGLTDMIPIVDGAAGDNKKLSLNTLLQLAPDLQALYAPFMVAASATAITVKANTYIKLIDGSNHTVHKFDADQSFTLSDILDTGTVQAGKNYCIYLTPAGDVVASLNTTYPDGYDEKTRKIGGLHTLCADVGTISGHPASGMSAGNIIPNSVWCLNHRPHRNCSPAGMAYVAGLNLWVDIYLQSGTGTSTASAYGATITDSRNWNNFQDDLAAVGKRFLNDGEFQVAAAGSNEQTNISGEADPVTTGGHVDTAGRRMISNYFLEDCCGAMWQWLSDHSYRFDGAANHTHQVTVSGDPETVTSGNPSGDLAPAWAWYSLPGGKGQLHRQGGYGDVKLLAGGYWPTGSACGSRCRFADYYRWAENSTIGARGCAEPM